jgi:phosphohistidine phosphatase SixA
MNERLSRLPISRENDPIRTRDSGPDEEKGIICTSNTQSHPERCTYENKLFFPSYTNFDSLIPAVRRAGKKKDRLDCETLTSIQLLTYLAECITVYSKDMVRPVFVLTAHSDRLKQMFKGKGMKEFSNGCVLKIVGTLVTCISAGRVTKAKATRAVRPDTFRFSMPESLPTNCTLYIVRHGQAVPDRIKETSSILRIDGLLKIRSTPSIVADALLTQCGITDATDAGSFIVDNINEERNPLKQKTDFIFMASDLHRSQQTTMVIYTKLRDKEVLTGHKDLDTLTNELEALRNVRCTGKTLCDYGCKSIRTS